jgi:hypothetical protein
MPKELIELALTVKHQTEKAFLVTDGVNEVWLPKSQVEHHEEDGIFVIPFWLARDKELI